MKNIFKICLLLLIPFVGFSQNQPNVIVILADDIGTGDISHYRKMHSDNIIVETPTIDKLAKEGTIFTDAHSPAALCAPTRYAIMTGNHCYRSYAPSGVWGCYERSPIEPNQLTLGKLMKQAGYKTSFFGKWGYGMDFKRKSTNKLYRNPRVEHETDVDITKVIDRGPVQNGFDYSYMYPAGIQAEPYAAYENGVMDPIKEDSEIMLITQKYADKLGFKLDKKEGLGDSNWNPFNAGTLLINKAVNFIEESSKTKEPFFMYYCSQAVHKPHTPSKKLNGTKIAGTTPSNHLDMVKELDVQLEMMVQTLKKQGIYDNTLIIFTSDNGGLLIKKTMQSKHKSNTIYRGGKNQAYEGGTRVPFIAWWPGKVKANNVSNAPILGIDIMATLAGLTNQKIEENNAMDSSNLLPILLGEKKIQPHPFLITQSGTGKQGMITEDGWKLIIQFDKKEKGFNKRTPIALFNLNDNISENEKGNLISNPKFKGKIDQLFKKYNTTRDSKIKTGIL